VTAFRTAEIGVQIVALLALLPNFAALSQPVSTPQTTVIIFADRPLQPGEWTALSAALRTDLNTGDKELAPLDHQADFVRGDALRSGLEVRSAITVYLHGDCSLQPGGRRTAWGVPLGWVRRVDGRIEPFIHVDCTNIANVLAPQARFLGPEHRTDIMAGAVARVILHEWIHVATQNSGHAEEGIAKARFGVNDLIVDEPVFAGSGAGR